MPLSKKQLEIRDWWKALTTDEQIAYVEALTPVEAEQFRYQWFIHAHDKQLIPLLRDDWRCILLQTGKAFGKTRAASEFVRQCVYDGVKSFALIARISKDLRANNVLHPTSGILNVFPPNERPTYNQNNAEIIFHTGAVARLYTAEEPDSTRGLSAEVAIADELGAWQYPEEAWKNLTDGVREGKHPRILVITTPRKGVQILKELRERAKEPDKTKYHLVRGTSFDNAANLGEEYINDISLDKSSRAKQEYYGEDLSEEEGSLFKSSIIEKHRVLDHTKLPQFVRTVVGVDPAVSTKDSSDLTGIVCAALGVDGHVYILEDWTGKYTPNEWAKKAIQLYQTYQSSKIILESNQGGNLLSNNIKQINPYINTELSFNSLGKVILMEPVSAAYENGLIHHTRHFSYLEEQMTEYNPLLPNQKSPDAADALCIAVNYLLPKKKKASRSIVNLRW